MVLQRRQWWSFRPFPDSGPEPAKKLCFAKRLPNIPHNKRERIDTYVSQEPSRLTTSGTRSPQAAAGHPTVGKLQVSATPAMVDSAHLLRLKLLR